MHISRHLTRFSRACGSAFAALLLMAAPAANASFSVDVHPAGAIPDLPDPAGRAGKRGGTVNCAICGKPVERVRPCEYYRRRGEAVCDECCEECHRTEPFPCPDHDEREREKTEG